MSIDAVILPPEVRKGLDTSSAGSFDSNYR